MLWKSKKKNIPTMVSRIRNLWEKTQTIAQYCPEKVLTPGLLFSQIFSVKTALGNRWVEIASSNITYRDEAFVELFTVKFDKNSEFSVEIEINYQLVPDLTYHQIDLAIYEVEQAVEYSYQIASELERKHKKIEEELNNA